MKKRKLDSDYYRGQKRVFMKSKFIVALVVLAASCGAVLINGCSSSSSNTPKFTIYGAGQ